MKRPSEQDLAIQRFEKWASQFSPARNSKLFDTVKPSGYVPSEEFIGRYLSENQAEVLHKAALLALKAEHHVRLDLWQKRKG